MPVPFLGPLYLRQLGTRSGRWELGDHTRQWMFRCWIRDGLTLGALDAGLGEIFDCHSLHNGLMIVYSFESQ